MWPTACQDDTGLRRAKYAQGRTALSMPLLARDVPNRVARLRALGNSVVPQVAEQIGRAMMAAEGRGAEATATPFTGRPTGGRRIR